MYRLLVLGGAEMEDPAGTPLRRLTQPRQVALLAVLAVARGRGSTRDRLAALLWGESPEARARHNLSDALYHIRSALGADAIIAAGQVLHLNAGAASTDLGDFLDALDGGDPARAVALYRGPLLDGFHVSDAPAFEDWLALERRRLAALFAGALETLARAAEQAGDYVRAARQWRRLLAEDPLNSPVAIALARALSHAGDQGNAMEVLVGHQAQLRHEVGLDSGSGLLEAMQEIRAAATSVAAGSASARIAPSPSGSGHASGAPATPTTPVAGSRIPRRLVAAVTLGTVTVLLAVAGLSGRLARSEPVAVVATEITPVTSDPGFEFAPAISLDGRDVAYLAGRIGLPHLVIRSTVDPGVGEVSLAGPEWFPSWTSDGESVRFQRAYADDGAWYAVGRLGGATRSVTVPRGATWPAWAPDDGTVAFIIADTLLAVAADGGARRVIAVHGDSIGALHSLAWSPDGKRIAYVSGNPSWRWNANVGGSAIWVVDAGGGTPQRVTSADHLNASPVWLDARQLLFVSNRDGPRAVYVLEPGARGRRGEPRAIPGVADPYSISYSVAARRLAYAKLTVPQNVWVYPLGSPTPVSIREGRPVTGGIQVVQDHDVSPDGTWLVYDGNVQGNMDLYKLPLNGGPPVRLTRDPGNEFHPRWSPDGSEIAYHADRRDADGGHSVIMVLPAAGGEPRALTGSGGRDRYPEWSPDGLRIAFRSSRAGREEVRVVSRDRVGGPWHEAVQLPGVECCVVGWAPDGSGVLLVTGASLRLVSPAGDTLWQRSLDTTTGLSVVFGGFRFSADGGTVYLAANHADGRRGVWALDVAGGEPRLIIVNDDSTLINMDYHSVARDEIYVTVAKPESDIWVMNLRY